MPGVVRVFSFHPLDRKVLRCLCLGERKLGLGELEAMQEQGGAGSPRQLAE